MESKIHNSRIQKDSFSNETFILSSVIDLPSTWITKSKEDIPRFMELKTLLNKTKSQLDNINQSFYNKIVKVSNLYTDLQDRIRELGGEVVTNAWLKMWEICFAIDDIFPEKDMAPFSSLHVAEAPGNFILAINHYLYNYHQNVKWTWFASTYKEESDTSGYLGDKYGLMRNYPNHWVFGKDDNGDITSENNIKTFIKDKVSLYTSDVKYVPQNNNYNEEENINIPVHVGHLLGALWNLAKGGTMVLKEFTLLETSSVCLLYIMCYCFGQVQLFKPDTSKKSNSEIYIIGTNYKRNLKEKEFIKLFEYLNLIRFKNTPAGCEALFQIADLNQKWLDDLYKVNKKITERQINELNQDVHHYNIYKGLNYDQLNKKYEPIRIKTVETWLKTFPVHQLNDNRKLIKNTKKL